jgi:hypothetical protein
MGAEGETGGHDEGNVNLQTHESNVANLCYENARYYISSLQKETSQYVSGFICLNVF